MNVKCILFASIVLFVSSCKTQLEITKPSESYIPPVVNNKPSTINIGVNLNISELEKSLNKAYKGVIYDDTNINDDNMMVKVSKVQDMKISITGNKISYSLPLKFVVKYKYKQNVLGVNIENTYDAQGALTVTMNSLFSIDKSWNIKTETTIEKYNWTEKPTIKVIGFDLPVTAIADVAIVTMRKDITKIIDESIADIADLKSSMTDMWKTLQTPSQMDKDYDIWLRIQPKSIYSTPIVGSGNKLSFTIGLQTIIETSVGTKLTPVLPYSKLPNYEIKNSVSPDFSIHSNIHVSYSKITDLAKQTVVGQEFTQGRKKVTIDSVGIFGHEDKIIVVVGLQGSVKGLVYCTGKLSYNDSLQSLQIKDFDFDVNTKNSLVKSANWLAHKSFLKLIEPMLTISLKDQITETLTSGNEMLKNYTITKGVALKGKLQKIEIQNIYITPQSVIIGGNIKGAIKIELGDLL